MWNYVFQQIQSNKYKKKYMENSNLQYFVIHDAIEVIFMKLTNDIG